MKTVALLAEGVDRNYAAGKLTDEHYASPSSRRAWIEIREMQTAADGIVCRPPRGGRG